MKLKRSIINALLQFACFQEVLNVSDLEYFMYFSMFRQFNIYKMSEKPDIMYLCVTLELQIFLCKLLIFMGHTLVNLCQWQIYRDTFLVMYFSRHMVSFNCLSSTVLRVCNSIVLQLNDSGEQIRVKSFALLQLRTNLIIFQQESLNFSNKSVNIAFMF